MSDGSSSEGEYGELPNHYQIPKEREVDEEEAEEDELEEGEILSLPHPFRAVCNHLSDR